MLLGFPDYLGYLPWLAGRWFGWYLPHVLLLLKNPSTDGRRCSPVLPLPHMVLNCPDVLIGRQLSPGRATNSLCTILRWFPTMLLKCKSTCNITGI
eukprot:1379604-Heterocapsa_arctica.AAC.1